jgi:S1-C subfamily serine protease
VAASAGLTHELWPAASVTPAVALQLPPATQTPATQTPATQTPSGTSGGSANTSSVAAKASPALVDINTNFQYQSASGAGTGIVLTSTGEILTNNHVINGETSIQVTDIGNGRTYAANVVGYDATNDIAVLQLVGASGLQTADIGNSDNLTVGQSVVAIGNAGGTGGTPTAAGGTITALNQAITAGDELNGTSENLSNLIETNADVQSGDSGGSLVNSAGQVIGIDSAASQGMALQSAASSTNQGYAIPINQALSIAKQIEAGQASSTVHVGSTAFLGVLISSGSSSPVQGNGFGSFGGSGSGGSGSTSSGATISGVVPGGSAATAGLAAGDVITSVDGQAVTSPAMLTQIMAQQHPGQSIQVGWSDQSGATHTTTVNLQSGPPA